jgi:hypothetical protein
MTSRAERGLGFVAVVGSVGSGRLAVSCAVATSGGGAMAKSDRNSARRRITESDSNGRAEEMRMGIEA